MDETMQAESLEMPVIRPPRPWGKIIGGILLFIVVLAVAVYHFVLTPYIVVGRSVAKFAQHDSGEMTYKSEGGDVVLVASARDDSANIELTLSNMEGVEGEIKLSSKFIENEWYVQAKYPTPKDIETGLSTVFPQIKLTNSYKMAAPLWSGEKWLHMSIPESEEMSEESEEAFVWDKESKKVMLDWMLAIHPGKVERNYGYEGENYTKVSFGFRKERLIKAIDNLKDLEIDMKVSQINSLIDIVESSDDWDRDLLTFLIDKKGELRVVIMQLPQIEEEVLNKGIAEGAKDDQTGMAEGLLSMAKGLVWGDNERELVQLGSVRFDKFDEIEKPVIPTEIVEGSALWEMIMVEFGPIIGQIFASMGQGAQ